MKNTFRARRLELGLTGLEVANKLGVRESTYLRWERGETVPLAMYVKALERALSAPWSKLWTEE